jgi:hypothetical protein
MSPDNEKSCIYCGNSFPPEPNITMSPTLTSHAQLSITTMELLSQTATSPGMKSQRKRICCGKY